MDKVCREFSHICSPTEHSVDYNTHLTLNPCIMIWGFNLHTAVSLSVFCHPPWVTQNCPISSERSYAAETYRSIVSSDKSGVKH